MAAVALTIAAGLGGCGGGSAAPHPQPHHAQVSASSGSRAGLVPHAGSIPPLLDQHNVYAAERPGLLSPTVRGDPALVYVPNSSVVLANADTGRGHKHR